MVCDSHFENDVFLEKWKALGAEIFEVETALDNLEP